jgi:hypothetical protein
MLSTRKFSNSHLRSFAGLFARPVRRRRSSGMVGITEACERRCVPAALGAAPVAYVNYQDDIIVLGSAMDDSDGENSIQFNVDWFNDGTVDDVVYAEYDNQSGEYFWNYPVAQFLGTPMDIDVKFTPVESNGSQSHSGNSVTITIEEE